MTRPTPPDCVLFHQLEARLLFATQISFQDFSSTTGLTGNGFGGSPIAAGNRLRLTDSQDFTARSVWFNTAVPITEFRTNFSFRIRVEPDRKRTA